MFEYLFYPSLCAALTGISAAPFGCLLIWRRLVYFGEALAHSSLLGISLAYVFDLPLLACVWPLTMLMVWLLFVIERRSGQDSNNILGTLSHIALALGMIVFASLENIRGDLLSYLFGDLLACHQRELFQLSAVDALLCLLLFFLWKRLILLTLNRDFAACEIQHSAWIEIAFLILLATYITFAVQYFGLLLIVALLIIPANTANLLAHSPEQSIFIAALCGLLATALGMTLAWYGDLPAAPAIVVGTALLYFAALLAKKLVASSF